MSKWKWYTRLSHDGLIDEVHAENGDLYIPIPTQYDCVIAKIPHAVLMDAINYCDKDTESQDENDELSGFNLKLELYKNDVKNFFATYHSDDGDESREEINLLRTATRLLYKAEEIIKNN